MKKLLTVLGGAMFFFAFAFQADAATLQAKWGEGEDHGRIFVTATGDIKEIEVDFYLPEGFDFSLPKGLVGENGKVGFGIKDGGSESIEVGDNLYIAYDFLEEDEMWELDFTDLGEDAVNQLREVNIYMALRGNDQGKYLLGSMYNTRACNTLTAANPINTNSDDCNPYFVLEGFENSTVTVGKAKEFTGAIAKISGADLIWNGSVAQDTAYEMTISVSGDGYDEGDFVLTTKNPEGGEPLTLGIEDTFDVFEITPGNYGNIPLDITVLAKKAGVYTFTVELTVYGKSELRKEESFTLTVEKARSSGGRGYSRPRVDEDTEDEEDAEDSEESTDEATDVISDITSEVADLMEQVANYNDLSDEERANLAVRLAEMMTKLQEQLREVSGASDHDFTRDLTVGSVGEDVRALQIFLNANGFTVAESGAGSAGSETNYFGELTRQALARYQAANGISPAAGYFGAITRAHIEG